MKIDRDSFFKIFKTRFWKKLDESLVPFSTRPKKEEFLSQLYDEITELTYNPSQPREYIVVDKHNGISRYVPTFSRKDYCVFYLCVKLLENEIAGNRVEGTYGGWTLGNPIRLKEEQEILELEYAPFNSLDPFAWTEHWQSFQGVARKYAEASDWNYFVTLDIANFYDSINLTLLEREIRHVVPRTKQEVVTLLFHFLRNWNRRIEGYSLKTVGIPQDEISDCSRILANFYLQGYDLTMKVIADKYGAKLIRYADDHIIFSKNKEDARKLIFAASRELLRLGLNFNSSKVREFGSKAKFDRYWAFDIFDLLKDKTDRRKVNLAIGMFFERQEKGEVFRSSSVLKRILSMDANLILPKYRHQLLAQFLDPSFLASVDIWWFKRIRKFLNDDDELFSTLDGMISEVQFNSFHYALLAFYKKERKGWDNAQLESRIEEIRLQ